MLSSAEERFVSFAIVTSTLHRLDMGATASVIVVVTRPPNTPGGLIVHSHARSSRQLLFPLSLITNEILSSQSPSGSSDRIGRMLQLLDEAIRVLGQTEVPSRPTASKEIVDALSTSMIEEHDSERSLLWFVVANS
ncbi:hypothetical protein GUITHDRAFT_121253 [Guillardia theta CCMP2712]|uniref:Uncharacterized protein n=1 Tax=Guillardia theta (strain CCMP2712) TaxID=905079 RepID=L1I8J0_GUITC|nr:hypothetical protein GUITHDRAFT_121253 [Guillardia theta CCMP2712]EKX32586.1 hypothetical protein GUITHDRAFT_121253 [Guillardia theta CCMP2712]|eukprot:XP_005819566.1 hypothetical protein GUITHDRAFT_121253 [Guillardia theta CCMP2712]